MRIVCVCVCVFALARLVRCRCQKKKSISAFRISPAPRRVESSRTQPGFNAGWSGEIISSPRSLGNVLNFQRMTRDGTNARRE